jgi:type VI secretion system protein ImpK
VGALGGLNALIAAANPVLAVAAQIRHTLKHPDPAGLRASLQKGMASFEDEARAAGASAESIAASRTALEALVGESAASTPWGKGWDSTDGEEFFRILHAAMADPAANRDLLEFLYVCLALGYEGRYRREAGGQAALVDLRASVLEKIRGLRPSHDHQLSANWRGVDMPARRRPGTLGIWAAASGLALLLAAAYIAYSLSLGGLSDPVTREIAQLKAKPVPVVARSSSIPSPKIAEQLATEISRGEVAVTDEAGKSTIVIRSDRLFASGSSRLESGLEPVVTRVADALDRVPGAIVVTGHTDDVPIRTARFPSNWELSTERAASVARLLATRVKAAGRISTEGVADSAPAAPNDSAANRARNRRVEIILRSVQ